MRTTDRVMRTTDRIYVKRTVSLSGTSNIKKYQEETHKKGTTSDAKKDMRYNTTDKNNFETNGAFRNNK